VCVNKADINPLRTEQIRQYCERDALYFAGIIPYDPLAIEAVNRGITIADIPCPSGRAVEAIYRNILPLLETGQPVALNVSNKA
jgi:MinD superfamily P-loop ATPase